MRTQTVGLEFVFPALIIAFQDGDRKQRKPSNSGTHQLDGIFNSQKDKQTGTIPQKKENRPLSKRPVPDAVPTLQPEHEQKRR
jgi:hypothetical protein